MTLSASLARAVESLVQAYDRPCLLYDAAVIAARVRRLRALEPLHGCRFLFAVKACGETWLLDLMCREGLGFDVANVAELAAVRAAAAAAGTRPSFLSVSGPAGADAFCDAAVDVIHLDGAAQFDSVSEGNAVLGLRVALPEAGAADDAPWTSRFGARPGTPGFARILADPRFGALHCHRQGPRKLDEIVATGTALAGLAGDRPLRYLNLGGGLGPHKAETIGAAVALLRKVVPAATTILIEPGSHWFTGAGHALGRILAIEPLAPGVHRVTLDLSKDCHLRWSDIVPLTANGLPAGKVLLVGPTCHEGDIIGAFEVPETAAAPDALPPGFVLLGNVDGYSAAWNLGFNGIPAARVMVHGET
jgi:diaminopimelate decarboxylase